MLGAFLSIFIKMFPNQHLGTLFWAESYYHYVTNYLFSTIFYIFNLQSYEDRIICK